MGETALKNQICSSNNSVGKVEVENMLILVIGFALLFTYRALHWLKIHFTSSYFGGKGLACTTVIRDVN
ncbi:hypothetical protein [Oceanobacillus senegalensis]|uniref:hypothetical protein n=1 Tax=Oceanobacillus senegalensis TaxID=1936063 RepID=UPI001C4E8348|nr:hypothetical protein [Oceanobacillus senegalensis]